MSFGFGIGDFIAVLTLANKVQNQFANAPKEFENISDEVKSLSLALLNAEFGVETASAETARGQKTSLEKASPVLAGCRTLLLELEKFNDKHSVLKKDTSDGTRTKFKRLWERVNWDSGEIRDFRQRLVSNVLLLNKLEQRHIYGDVKSLLRQQIEHGHSEMVDWISPIDFAKKQRDLLSERVDNVSGTWILTTEQYITWVRGRGRTLFCWGMPGGGKTMTAAMVVDHLQSLNGGHGDIFVAYIYCRYQSHNQSADQLFGSILRSLVRQSPKIPDIFDTIFKDRHPTRRGDTLRSEEVMTAIAAVLSSARNKYIVIDAVDELDDDVRAILLRHLANLRSGTGVNLFLTSRQQPKASMDTSNDRSSGTSSIEHSIKTLVEGIQALSTSWKVEDLLLDLDMEIRAMDRDVERYLRAEQNILLLPKCVRQRPQLQEAIITSIVGSVDGMFLLAVLHLQSLKRKTTVKQINDALKSMTDSGGSNAYDRAYDDAMQRIESQAEELRDLARRTLSILMCARRLLSPDELCHALSVVVIEEEADEDNVPDIEDVLKSCAGLVTVDQESNCVRLVHNSTKEYLDRNRSTKFSDAQKYVEDLRHVYLNIKDGQGSRGPFYEYAKDNWWHHTPEARKAQEDRRLKGQHMPAHILPSVQPSLSLPMPTGLARFWQQPGMRTALLATIKQGCQTGDLSLLESILDASQYDRSNDVTPLLLLAIQSQQHRIV